MAENGQTSGTTMTTSQAMEIVAKDKIRKAKKNAALKAWRVKNKAKYAAYIKQWHLNRKTQVEAAKKLLAK